MAIEYILMLLVILMPYNFVGEELGSLIILLSGCCYLIFNKEEIKVSKKYLYSLILLAVLGCLSLVFTKNVTRTLGGLSIYINGIIFYFIFTKLSSQKEKVIKFILYVSAAFAIIFVVYQGVVFKKRIDGNLGYAGSYGLFLLSCVYLCEILKEKTYLKVFLQFIFMIGIIYTGSRNTFVYLAVFIALKLYFDRKQKEKFSVLLSLFISVAVYLMLQFGGFGMVFMLPIIIYLAYVVFKTLSYKVRNMLIIAIGAGSILLLFIFKTSLLNRLLNINLQSGVLQERFVYFQDVIKQILINPLGSGINSFEYKQYLTQSAFYDVRFVHNSVLQSVYDMGVPGMLAFIAVGFIGIYIIAKSKNEDKRIFGAVFITVYLHSLLDFDFSYATIMIYVVMLVAFSAGDTIRQKDAGSSSKTLKYAAIAIAPVLCYLIMVHSLYIIGDHALNNKNIKTAQNCYSINRRITIGDPDCYSKLAETYLEETSEKAVEEIISNLSTANKINPYDPRVIGNLALINQQKGDVKQAILYFDKFLVNEKYYSKIYDIYYNFLQKQYEATKDEFYKNKAQEVIASYKENLKNLNPKAKYMNDQMSAETIPQ